ncbi:hypothetical protein C8F04DRAFT_1257783 [Mycena alexandri]|uniref:Uncharacterized protein n=1 Tax=Mycena alexandri TaxID=1745969 RepID=A0AAD6T3B3_9AGAR|nr:hypothetical protein C8F04DRAFT_1257783 [Mycena alexandri]
MSFRSCIFKMWRRTWIFYPADLSTFSPRIVLLDEDVGTVGIFAQTTTTSLTTGYTGPVPNLYDVQAKLPSLGVGGEIVLLESM